MNSRFFRWQILMMFLMTIGYSGYYLCRSNFSVLLPQLILELTKYGYTAADAKIQLGMIASIGVLGYAMGKFVSGGLSDFLGGRIGFLTGMLGAIGFTMLFAFGGGIPLFTFAWIGNRLFQSMGWVGMVKITSRWFSYSSYGTAMGIISLSYLFGDAIARKLMSTFISMGFTWRGTFYLAAGILSVLFLINFFLLKESPADVGEQEPLANENNLFGKEGQTATPIPMRRLLYTIFSSRSFWIVCTLSLGCTFVRETFNTWTPTYFNEVLGFSPAEAAAQSAWFPFFGGISVLFAGFLSDRIGDGGRAKIIVVGLLLSGIALLFLARGGISDSRQATVAMVALIAFLIMGPYSYLGGAIALDYGGKQASATVCGLFDGVGYLGGCLAGGSIAKISVLYGWKGAFTVLACTAWASSLAAVFLLFENQRASVQSGNLPLKEGLGPDKGFEGAPA